MSFQNVQRAMDLYPWLNSGASKDLKRKDHYALYGGSPRKKQDGLLFIRYHVFNYQTLLPFSRRHRLNFTNCKKG